LGDRSRNEMDIFIPGKFCIAALSTCGLKHESGELLGNYAGKTHTTLFISPRVHRVFCLAVLEFQPREKRCHFLRNIRNNELSAAAVASVLHDAPHERSRSIVLRRSLTYLDDTMSQHEGSVSAHRARSTAAPRPDEQRMFVPAVRRKTNLHAFRSPRSLSPTCRCRVTCSS